MRFNLSAWALRHRSLVVYAMLVAAIAGAFSYLDLGRSEDPEFTFKVMVIHTLWPGADAAQVAAQVTEPIERKIMETGEYEFVRSYSRAGESQVIFAARDAMRSGEIPALNYQIRKKVGDLRPQLPRDIVGPFFNDEFGDTWGNLYALTGEGFDHALLHDWAERLQLQIERVPDVGKVALFGVQDERIWVELDNTRLATLGISPAQVQQQLEEQNAMMPAGYFELAELRVPVRVSGQFETVEQVRALPIRAGERTLSLGDIATVSRGYADPRDPGMRFMGEDGIAIGVAMRKGGDIIALGETLEAEVARLQGSLPVGMELRKVSDQPAAVRVSIGEFVRVLAEAVAIVLLTCFLSLGWRTGLVVALSIPLVLAMTFIAMEAFGVNLHKVSLGALVLALGLLVDDAIIAIEMMAVKLEQGFERTRAAAFAWESTAFPMLTGTLITAAGLLPIATAASSVGEYTRSLFQVVTFALLLSWIAAVVFIPYLGDKLLPDPHKVDATPRPGSLVARWRARRGRWADRHPALANLVGPRQRQADGHPHDPYDTGFYRRFRRLVAWSVRRRGLVIVLTVAAFAASVLLFRFIPQQFFPESVRPELMIDMELAEGSSLRATREQALRLEEMLATRDDLENYTAWVGTGAPRFYLPLDQQLPAANFAQFVLLAKDTQSREVVREWLLEEVAPRFPQLQLRVTRLEMGPPVGYPVQFRISGEHIDQVREIAYRVRERVRANPHVANVNLDWDEPSKVIRLELDQARARALGISSTQLAQTLQATLTGAEVGVFREGDRLISIMLRGGERERQSPEQLASVMIQTPGGPVPLAQLAEIEHGFEDGIIWHRDRVPTMTVRADVSGALLPAEVTAQIDPTLDAIRAELPPGYEVEIGGSVEDSARAQGSIAAGVPMFLLVVFTLLMIQLRSFSRSFMVLLTAPLGLIGVVVFLLVFRVPFGFVAMLGTIALAGMIMRNSVILVDQIEQDRAEGAEPWQAIVEATVRRFRPIVLTALTAILAMVPLSRSDFFGPMATAIMGGLLFATVLTLVFVPALYAAWFRVRIP